MDQDFLLIGKMRHGDEEAMELFVRKYYPQVLKYCSFHSGDTQRAEDLAQETFLRFFRALAGYSYQGKSLNYLYTIARNPCVDTFREKWEVPMEGFSEPGEEKMTGIDERLALESAMSKLPDELKEVVVLRFFQELRVKEIARILGIGAPSVKYRLKKALALLKQVLEEKEKKG